MFFCQLAFETLFSVTSKPSIFIVLGKKMKNCGKLAMIMQKNLTCVIYATKFTDF